MSVLAVHQLRKVFGDVVAVDDLSFTVDAAGVTGFIGHNGSGKSTTMNLVMGLLRPTAGEVRVFGDVVDAQRPSQRKQVGFLPQQVHLLPWMTAREVLQHVAELCGLPARQRKDTAADLLTRVGLPDDAHDRRVGGFSGGMRQRLGLAQALVGAPQLLLLDEPVAALDPQGRKDVLELLAELGQDIPVLMSSHILDDVERICSHLVGLHRGQLVLQGATQDLLHDDGGVLRLVIGGFAPEQRAALSTSLLDDIDAILAVDVVEEAPAAQAVFDLHVQSHDLVARALPAWLQTQGLSLYSLVHRRRTLEDVFLQLGDVDTSEEAA